MVNGELLPPSSLRRLPSAYCLLPTESEGEFELAGLLAVYDKMSLSTGKEETSNLKMNEQCWNVIENKGPTSSATY